MGDVVRARLETLLAEPGPRRALTRPSPDHGGPGTAAAPDAAEPDAAVPQAEVPQAEVPQAAEPQASQAQSARGNAGGPGSITTAVWSFGREHVTVLAVLGLVGVIWAVWWIAGARTVTVEPATPLATPVTPVLTAPATPTPTPPPTIRVHVLGAVHRPGVVVLPLGSRVEDALAAAGGLAEHARPGELNLAAVLADAAQVVVGSTEDPGGEIRAGTSEAGGSAGAGSPGGPALDLNTATADQLDALPGVGPVTAASILAWRAEHGRFTRVEELQEIDGIGPKTFTRLAPHVRV